MSLSRQDFLLSIICEIWEFHMQHFWKEVQFETKSNNMDFVSFVDKESQLLFTQKLHKLFPEDEILWEEDFDENQDYTQDKYLWIIDPLDGTLLYKKWIPLFGVMIAYIENGTILQSAIYLPALRELYHANLSWAYKNNEKIHVSTTLSLKSSLINLPYFSTTKHFNKNHHAYFEFQKNIWTSIDSYAIAFASCACASAKFDGGIFIPNYGNIWDTIPSGFLVQQAWWRVTTVGRDDWDIWDNKIIYSNNLIHSELQNVLGVEN